MCLKWCKHLSISFLCRNWSREYSILQRWHSLLCNDRQKTKSSGQRSHSARESSHDRMLCADICLSHTYHCAWFLLLFLSCRIMLTPIRCCPGKTWTRMHCCRTLVKQLISLPIISFLLWTLPSITMGSQMWPCLTLPACTPLRTQHWCASAGNTLCWSLWWGIVY